MLLIADIDAALDDSNAGDLARQHVAQIRRDYELEEQSTTPCRTTSSSASI
jgi:hypothetical protein